MKERNMIEISLTGTMRIIVNDDIFKEIQLKSITQEPITLKGIKMIIDSNTYKNEICPSENILTYFDAVIMI